ncbi:hypothetical protein HYV86_04360 [Candidatus Woesearchaeota archaeon]|nr:hypothetical protein [Candidatus Woesearchaeota archaeon]
MQNRFKKSLEKQTAHHQTRIILFLLFTFFILCAIIKWTTQRVFFDETVYLSIARYFISAGQYGYFEALRPLALPALLVPFQLLPFSSLLIARIATVLLSCVSLYVLYLILKKYSGLPTAIWVLFFMSTSSLIFLHSGYILTDIIAYTLGATAILTTFQKRYLLASMTLALAFLFKFPLALLLLPCGILFLIQKIQEKQDNPLSLLTESIKIMGIFLLTITPFLIFNITMYEGTLLERVTLPFIQGSLIVEQDTWVYETASVGRYFVTLIKFEPLLLLVCLSTFPLLWNKRRKELITLSTTIILFLLYFGLRVPRFDPRYILAVVPFLIIIAAMGISQANLSKVFKKVIIALGILTIAINLYIILPQQYEHSSQITSTLNSLHPNQKIMLTSNPVVFADFAGKGQFIDGQNQGHLFEQYQKNINIEWLALDPSQFACPKTLLTSQAICQKEQTQMVSYLLSRNKIITCGYYHGFPIIIFSKNATTTINPQICLQSINYTYLPPLPPTIEFRLNEIELDKEGNIQNLENVQRIITSLNQTHTPLTITISAANTSLSISTKEFLSTLHKNISLGVLTRPERNTIQFIEHVKQETSLKIISISPFGDDWTNYNEPFPQSVKQCYEGAWLQTKLVPITCTKVDMYTTKNWKTKETYSIAELQEMTRIQLQQDPHLVIDIWAPSLNDSQTADIESFIGILHQTLNTNEPFQIS